LLKLNDCRDPARVAEFNWWHDYSRAFDVLLTSVVSSASRYRNLDMGHQQPEYLTLYETTGEAYQTLEEIRRRVDPATELEIGVTRYFGAFNLVFSESAAWARTGV
jgi:hypothetical protein